jgi:hypothetical protein
MRLYNEKHLVSVHTVPSPATAIHFGRYGREDNTLITILKNGTLDIKVRPEQLLTHGAPLAAWWLARLPLGSKRLPYCPIKYLIGQQAKRLPPSDFYIVPALLFNQPTEHQRKAWHLSCVVHVFETDIMPRAHRLSPDVSSMVNV